RCTELVEVSPVPSDALSLSKCPQSPVPSDALSLSKCHQSPVTSPQSPVPYPHEKTFSANFKLYIRR
ncbi:MAG: hypothetical protein ACKO9I_19620, partial [Sphaerospermopsis kisseleviana]